MGHGSFIIFFNRPVAASFILLTVISVLLLMKVLRRVPKAVLTKEERM
jgi:TctA family transporter